jgi:hypothetical protein
MNSKMKTIVKKTHSRGWAWFWERIKEELRIPQTALGRNIKPINIFLYKTYCVLAAPFHVFSSFKPLNKDTLCVFYDLEVSPITFNFCEILGMANAKRIELGFKYIEIVFVPGSKDGLRAERADYEPVIDKESRHWRRYNILFPLTHLLPACSGFLNCATRKEAELIRRKMKPYIYPEKYHTVFPIAHNFFESARSSSKDLLALRATEQGLRYINQWLGYQSNGRKVITITLRQYNYMPQRNSNIAAWAEFAKSLDDAKYFVVIIPDTEQSLEGVNPVLSDFTHFNEACWNLELRAALYETAYLNLGVNNGPLAVCWMNQKSRYLLFKVHIEEVPQVSAQALAEYGLLPGGSPAFAMEYQKWVWKDDTFENIQDEFNKMCVIIDSQ